MVDAFQVDVLRRLKCQTEKRPKQHTCRVCQHKGQHARTCHDVFLREHLERADTFFRKLIETQKVDGYVSSLGRVNATPLLKPFSDVSTLPKQECLSETSNQFENGMGEL